MHYVLSLDSIWILLYRLIHKSLLVYIFHALKCAILYQSLYYLGFALLVTFELTKALAFEYEPMYFSCHIFFVKMSSPLTAKFPYDSCKFFGRFSKVNKYEISPPIAPSPRV